MELDNKTIVRERDDQYIGCQMEQIVKFTKDGCEVKYKIQIVYYFI